MTRKEEFLNKLLSSYKIKCIDSESINVWSFEFEDGEKFNLISELKHLVPEIQVE